VKLPAILRGGAGTQPAELAYLASICALLQPQVVFEIGTYTGLTTAVFVLNAPPGARVISLDLPPHPYLSEAEQARYLDTDLELIRERHLAKYLIELGLEGRYEQLLIDSMAFDPTPYAETVDLAFIDGAHSLAHVRNDTEKVARMLRPGGLVVWHDYGGRGRFRGLTSYLERLGRRARIYHVSGTTLAWATADELKAAVLDR
jgi:predicted O-methyltransferase YrrM